MPSAESTSLKIAVVARRIPVPIFTGINLVVNNITARLATQHEVKLFVTDDDPPSTPQLFAAPIAAAGKSGYGDTGGVIAASETYPNFLARYYGVPASRVQWLEREIGGFAPDVVLAFGYDLAPYLVPLLSRWPVVFDPIDSEVLYLWRTLRSGKLQLATMKHLLVSMALARTVLAKCDKLITVSNEDTRNLRVITGRREIYTVPNGVDCEFFVPRSEVRIVPGRIIFSGSLSWPPNAQALSWFLNECWAQVRQVRPDATLEIVGKGMTPEQQRAYSSSPNVLAVGFVDDIRRHVLAAEVSIAPMISGSGIKNKILESWAMARPVVATALAARGLDAQQGEHLLVAQLPSDFARAVLSLLNDPQLRDRLGAAGRSLATAQYSWESMSARVSVLLREAIGGRRAH